MGVGVGYVWGGCVSLVVVLIMWSGVGVLLGVWEYSCVCGYIGGVGVGCVGWVEGVMG